uniref:ATP synthase F0 subunit 8 n=1 Tax=Pristaulacus sp. ZJUH_2016030 TaxID=2491655 RepID=A0A3Q8UAB7_9HYME|nr:ATP synthase F0 subunit 8 [Pristaulacus sp. ZJUH_2016030]
MPQMCPLNWLLLFLFFNYLNLIFISKIYFLKFYYLNFSNLNLKLKKKMFLMKW